MGSHPLGRTISTFDPNLLQVNLASEITVIKSDERKRQSSTSTLNIHQIENTSKYDTNNFICFLCSKFYALKELSLDDELDDGNPVEIKKIDINKKVFPKKSKHTKFSKIIYINRQSNNDKIKKSIHRTSIQFSCENFLKGKFYKIDNLKEKSSSGKITEIISHERNFKSPKNLKFRHRHKKDAKSNKNKDYKENTSLSTIKSKKSGCDNEINNIKEGSKNIQDSIESIRSILKEMGN